MRVSSAQLPGKQHSDDKVFTTDNAVIVLDGASAFRPVPVPASLYADRLGRHLRDALTTTPDADLRETLHTAIAHSATELDLRAGDSPSSTVAIVRHFHGVVDALVLGDTPIVFPSGVFADDRIDEVAVTQRRRYRHRLASGSGYDDQHKRLLEELQGEQIIWRNIDGGYWIAEADPNAAAHALTTRRELDHTPWAVLATDGAFNTADHLGLGNWSAIASYTDAQLATLLDGLHLWEAEHDPHGQAFPRSKRHDDKAIAAVQWLTA